MKLKFIVVNLPLFCKQFSKSLLAFYADFKQNLFKLRSRTKSSRTCCLQVQPVLVFKRR